MDRNEVWDIVNRATEELLVRKLCPVCKVEMLMAKLIYEYKDGEDLWAMSHKYRCLGCLGLFKEELTVITPEAE